MKIFLPAPKRTSRVDTIVEVLIAISIISTILAGGFVTANAAQTGLRDAQEHAEATTILQSQIESLRPLASNSASQIYGSSIFCIDSSGHVQSGFGFSPPTLSSNNWSQYPAACRNINNFYNLSVSYDNTTNVFTFISRWDRQSGGQNQVMLFYKISPAPVASSLPVYSSCADPGITAEAYYFNFYKYPSPVSKDWHVGYIDPFGPSHSISTIPNPASGSLHIPAGNYYYWAFAKDGNVNSGAINRSLHYNFYDQIGGLMSSTVDTPDIIVGVPYDPLDKPNGVVSAEGSGTVTVQPGQAIASIKVEHSPINLSSHDDGVDAACLALRPIP